eukprot:4053256-Prymnesium_polylepis.2
MPRAASPEQTSTTCSRSPSACSTRSASARTSALSSGWKTPHSMPPSRSVAAARSTPSAALAKTSVGHRRARRSSRSASSRDAGASSPPSTGTNSVVSVVTGRCAPSERIHWTRG